MKRWVKYEILDLDAIIEALNQKDEFLKRRNERQAKNQEDSKHLIQIKTAKQGMVK